ncbi:hypothetical protein K7W03_22095 [Sphingobium sp. PNB]|uniref:hypothetical protein n=1 Tax=Sphingobium sp. PNB TaxID=863934 RepID=UPI001CA3AA2A|nr:hypothetical protein [Sphingobium sp. PNB]MCB4862286.1 hypothetical protein [Sphingobium sp. PNB]
MAMRFHPAHAESSLPDIPPPQKRAAFQKEAIHNGQSSSKPARMAVFAFSMSSEGLKATVGEDYGSIKIITIMK